MANDNKSKDLDPVLVGRAISGDSDISKKLAELYYKRLLKQDLEEEEADRLKQVARLAGIEAQVTRRKAELMKQEQCPHKKPYGESALAGQRLHSHKHLYICQYCAKEWFDNEVPNELRIGSEVVGGPNY